MSYEVKKLFEKLDQLRKDKARLTESHDELLAALSVAADEEDGYVFNDTIKRATALKEEMFNESLPFK